MTTQQEIIDAARMLGIDPRYMLAVASRESNFDPNAGGTGSIRGLYQTTRAIRKEHNIPEGGSVQAQTEGFDRYNQQLKADMTRRMGREPTDSELYMGHHFGPYRASKMATGRYDPNTPVHQIFTPLELRGNPHIVKAGTIGNLTQQTLGDMNRRLTKYGGMQQDPVLAGGPPGRGSPDNVTDFSEFAEGGKPMAQNKEPDFSEFAAAAKAPPSEPNTMEAQLKNVLPPDEPPPDKTGAYFGTPPKKAARKEEAPSLLPPEDMPPLPGQAGLFNPGIFGG